MHHFIALEDIFVLAHVIPAGAANDEADIKSNK